MQTQKVEPVGPLARYRHDIEHSGFQPDQAQMEAVKALQLVYDDLVERYQLGLSLRGLARISEIRRQRTPAQGLYLWGGVGRGKTYLMDVFFEELPFRRKLRVHFHRFMQRVHKELKLLQGTKDPLHAVADIIHKEAVVICFDEFYVSDIADAMILGGLFEQLFARGVSLVATSNIVPDKLYENGLQRQRFLPAITMVKQFCQVLNVDSGVDYRLRVLERAELYHFPLDAGAHLSLAASFGELSQNAVVLHQPLDINDRSVDLVARTEDVLWCTFAELCNRPRSPSDYIEIAREFHTVLLADVPQMGAENDDAARRFINLVDEFYDRGVKLIMSAACPIVQLYEDGRLTFEFQRTQSRLQEMQSRDYLACAHCP